MSRSARGRISMLGLVLMSVLNSQRLEAAEVTLSAEYKGGGPSEWIHTTPPAPNCIEVAPLCRGQNSVGVPISYRKLVVTTKADPRSNFYGSFPASRPFQLVHEQTGATHQAALAFLYYSQAVDYHDPGRNPANTPYTMGGTCSVQHPRPRSATTIVTHWRYVRTPGTCYTRANYSDQPATVEVSDLALTYKLELPPAYRLKPGRYKGSVTYSLGDGGDFDFGANVTQLSDLTVTFNIVIDVSHEFRVEFGPGFEQATLEPPGGWTSWLDGGRVPPKIFSDKSLRLWSTGPFRVYKLCEFDAGERCAMRNRSGQQIPLQVLVTMPYTLRYGGWQTVTRWPLPTGRAASLELQAMLQTINAPAQVHFEVAQADLQPMLDRAGERFSGKVTLIFDAEL